MLKLLALSFFGLANAASPGTAAALCTQLLGSVCSAAGAPNVFAGLTVSPGDCAALFANFPAGMDDATSGNTLGCRIQYAMRATNASTAHWCRYGGFSGGGLCGAPLDGTCQMIVNACPGALSYPDTATCMGANGLQSLQAIWGSKQGTPAAAENTLECRAYHALVGYNAGAPTVVHCNHTKAVAAGGQPCSANVTHDIQHHCTTITQYCTGAAQQYNSIADCMASAAVFPPGNADDVNLGNNIGCRQYHAQAASLLGAVHCYHAGPSGANVCGTTRDAWRALAGNSFCATAGANYSWVATSVGAAFATWAAADIQAVMPAGTGNYVTSSTGDNDYCRIYHLTVAINNQLSHCEHGSITSSTCSDGTNVPGAAAICRMILAGCGSTAPNGVYADVAACLTAISPIVTARPGDQTSMAPTGDNAACRAFQAASALTAKNMGAAGAAGVTAACQSARASVGPGCGGAPAKSGAAAVAVSVAALVFPLFL